MKNVLRHYIYASARDPRFYRYFWHPLSRITALAYREHYDAATRGKADPSEIIRALSPESRVMHGPFKGMVYPDGQSAGSAFFPKILGSYEQELHDFLDEAIATDYGAIVDIGCAEGYYAVGFGMRCPGATIRAFDTDERAKVLCRAMARANGVDDRLHLEGFARLPKLIAVAGEGRALVISDCEGFENELFSAETCRALSRADLLIEIHDFLRPGTSAQLYSRLCLTHRVERIRSIPDVARPQVFRYSELADVDDGAKIRLMAEIRPLPMEWFVCRSLG